MRYKIIWSNQAKNQRKDILKYWTKRNQSDTYTKKLNILFGITIDSIRNFPNAGSQTEINDVRMRIARDYKIFYTANKDSILIIAIFHMKRNPKIVSKHLNK